MKSRAVAALVAVLALGTTGCDSRGARSAPPLAASHDASAATLDAARTGSSIAPRVIRFAWRPPRGDEAAYAMTDPEDQHRIVIVGPPVTGASPAPDTRPSIPVLIALHGQPKRGQSPRAYAFPERVIAAASDLVERGDVPPLAVALPVFRFGGVNWPAFDLVAFRQVVEERMAREGLVAKDFYVVGHSGAAGCGGDGMNRVHRMDPAAVGFFDTCLGPGFRDEVRALLRARVPTSILQSVETAGVQPRHLREYDGRYDFGPILRSVGLAPVACPEHLPEAPLRPQPYRCAADASGIARAFLVDTGEGEEAHNALVSVALAYFLRAHLRPAR